MLPSEYPTASFSGLFSCTDIQAICLCTAKRTGLVMKAPKAEIPLQDRVLPYKAIRLAEIVTLGVGAMFLLGASSASSSKENWGSGSVSFVGFTPWCLMPETRVGLITFLLSTFFFSMEAFLSGFYPATVLLSSFTSDLVSTFIFYFCLLGYGFSYFA